MQPHLISWTSSRGSLSPGKPEVDTVHGRTDADVYLPDQQMVAAELWDFDGWYSRDMTSFLERVQPQG